MRYVVCLGAVLAVSLCSFEIVEMANGWPDQTAHDVRLPIVTVYLNQGRSPPFYSVVVKERGVEREIVWGSINPLTDQVTGCSVVRGREGQGMLGMRWIGQRRVAPC